MKSCNKEEALLILQDLIGKTFRKGRKSPDTELYEIVFGDLLQYREAEGEELPVYSHIIHALCDIVIINKNIRQTKRLFSNTENSEFEDAIKHIIGKKVTKTIINNQNDLLICIEDYDVIFLASTAEDEAWRYFTVINLGIDPHLVVSETDMYLV